MHQHSINQSDLELAATCCSGDRKAQRVLFDRIKKTMFAVCLRFCGSRSDAEDLFQEGLIEVYRHLGKYRGEGSLEGWVRRIFVRAGIEYIRRQEKLPASVEIDMLEQVLHNTGTEFDPDDPESAIALLQQMPPGFRAVLNLAVLEDKSHEEIARELGIAVSTSRSQLARAKEFLRKIIRKPLVFI